MNPYSIPWREEKRWIRWHHLKMPNPGLLSFYFSQLIWATAQRKLALKGELGNPRGKRPVIL